jgi:hypothetical protein
MYQLDALRYAGNGLSGIMVEITQCSERPTAAFNYCMHSQKWASSGYSKRKNRFFYISSFTIIIIDPKTLTLRSESRKIEDIPIRNPTALFKKWSQNHALDAALALGPHGFFSPFARHTHWPGFWRYSPGLSVSNLSPSFDPLPNRPPFPCSNLFQFHRIVSANVSSPLAPLAFPRLARLWPLFPSHIKIMPLFIFQ